MISNRVLFFIISHFLIFKLYQCVSFEKPEINQELNGKPLSGKFPPIGPGTDRALYNPELFEGDIVLQQNEIILGRNAVADSNLLWPHGTIIYKVDDNIGCPESPQCEILMKAMDHYHQKSCIRFKEWTGERDYVTIFFNSDSGSCWSAVGRTGREQKLSLGQRCWYLGIVIHELGHAAGFWHEMNRPDRDSWIYVYWNNIISGFASAFAKYDTSRVATLGESFDYKSIMMYDEYAFSKDGMSPTLRAKTGQEIGPIWKKAGMSASDIRRMHRLYKCDGNRPKSTFPYDIPCNFNSHTCGFKNGGSSVWNWRTVNETDGYVYSSYEIAGTTPGYLLSVNLHPKESKDERLGCVRFWYFISADGKASLTLSQIYLNKVTKRNHNSDDLYNLWRNETSSREWIHVEVPLYVTRSFKLIFQSEFGNNNKYGTVALDDVEINYTECANEENIISAGPTPVANTMFMNSKPIASTSMSNIKKRPIGILY